jgi:fatty acid amide hydrolase 2
MIRDKRASAREVVEAHIERIRAVNPVLNAVVVERFEAAIAEARAADEAQAHGAALPPLHGVPFTVKEEISMAGAPCTIGSVHRSTVRAERDATVLGRLRSAGAIVTGQTNLSEMALWIECENVVYGRTSNPWDPTRTSGGSSGGEGAIVGAGGSPFGLGSDGGGSLRLPASFCGVFTHKPSSGIVPLTGHYPMIDGIEWQRFSDWSRYFTLGPMTRRASDLYPLLELIAGEDGLDPSAIPFSIAAPTEGSFAGRRVFVCEDMRIFGGSRVTEEVRRAVRSAALALQERGAHVESFEHRHFRRAMEIWAAIVSESGGPSLEEVFGGGARLSFLREISETIRGRPAHTLPALALSAGERLFKPSAKAMQRRRSEAAALKAAIESAIGDGVILTPVYPTTAPKHGRSLLRPLDVGTTAIFNVLGLPVTVAPVCRDEAGLPIGVQIVGATGGDNVTLTAALRIEEAFGGWQRPEPQLGEVASCRAS